MRAACLLFAITMAASAQVRLPEYTTRTLENGVRLQLLAKRDVPLVALQATVRGGAEADPAEKAGLASVTAAMLRRGTKSRSAEQFSAELDSIGATFSASADEQATYVSARFLSKDLDKAIDLFADVIVDPAFPEAEVTKLLRQRIDSVRASKDSARGVMRSYYREFFFPAGHPYAKQPRGDELTLERLNREDITGYHRKAYTGRNLVVTAVGDFDVDVLERRLAAKFGKLPAGEAYEWVTEAPPLAREKARLVLVDKPDATQTYFFIGQPGISRTDKDRVAMALINTLFGGRFTSLLNDALRVNAGLTYGAYSSMQRNRLQGWLAIDSYTPTETTAQAIDLALEVLRGLHENGIDAGQLASAKAYVKGRFPTRSVETAGQLANVLGDLALYGLGRDEIDEFFARIDAVTLEQANAIIKKHYRTENLQFLLLGNAAAIKDEVAKYAGEAPVIPVTKPGFHTE